MRLPPDLVAALERGATLVTATRRLARAMRSGYAASRIEAGREAWESPEIVTWSGWLDRQWTALLHLGAPGMKPRLTPAQEASLWERAIQDHPDAAALLNLAPAAGAAARAWDLIHEWRIPKSGAAWQSHADAMAFLEWRERFESDCWDLGRIDSARSPDQVLAALQSGSIAAPPELWFAGFDLFTPRHREFLEAMHGAGTTIRVLEAETEPGPAVLESHADSEAQWRAAAAWSLGLVERKAGSIGIIAPNLDRQRALAERVFRESLGGAFHISLGPKLDAWPVAAVALTIAELVRPRTSFATISRLLLSPYVRGAAQERSERALFELELRRQHATEIAWAASPASAPAPPMWTAALANAHEAIRAVSGEQRRPSQWSRAISRLLTSLGWPGDASPSSGEYQAIDAWHDALSELAALDLTLPPISAGKALALLREITSRPFEPENRDEPVQILSVNESTGECFEHSWLLGFDDSAWPPVAAPQPFVPVMLQRARGVPRASAEGALGQAKRATVRLLASAGDIVVSFARTEGERSLAPSPLVAHLPLHDAAAARPAWTPVPLETAEDTPPPPLAVSATAAGGTRVLQLQAACPFRAFAEMRLRAQELDEPDLGLEPRERGTVLHAALEECWRRLGGSRGLAGDLDAVIAPSVESALDTQPHLWRGAFGARLRELEAARLVRLIGEWLAFERKRAVPFTTEPGEQKREVQIGGLTLRTRLDRQDRLSDGRLVLIDYKSGQPTLSAWEGDRPDEPQLPLYAVSTLKPLAAVAFAQVRSGDVRFKGISAAAAALPEAKEIASADLDRRLNDWRSVLAALAQDFAAGRSEVDPKQAPQTCQYCHLRTLCRVHEMELR
ncbi:MAG: PD-(D/E)XK nuclease family protein [Bryobacteraceae bacterium]